MSEEIVNLSEAIAERLSDNEEGIGDEDENLSAKWKALRDLLKNALLTEEIPVEPAALKPKQVWQKYMDAAHPAIEFVDYKDKKIQEKYGRMLRSLRQKHKDGDLENEGKNTKQIVWAKSAAKQYLKQCFREQLISVDYEDPQLVWNDQCQGHRAFERMEFDSAFVRRLATVRDDYIKKRERCENDLKAYRIAKQNHPTPEFNSRGEPQWNKSKAQKMLKEIVERGDHKGKPPKSIWETKAEFQVYSLQTFRDHIYQEERLVKFNNYVQLLKKRKIDKLQY